MTPEMTVCPLHELLEEQILQLGRELHDTKMAIIRIMIATCSAITGIVGAGVCL